MAVESYKGEVASKHQETWSLAQAQIWRAQKRQKAIYDRKTSPPTYRVGDSVFVYMPGAKASKAYKFARPFYGPYRVVAVYDTGSEVRPVDKPTGDQFALHLTGCADALNRSLMSTG